jgi:hypothetical protein
MVADKGETLVRLRSVRHDLIDPRSTKGRTLKNTKDSITVDFAKAVRATRIAAG